MFSISRYQNAKRAWNIIVDRAFKLSPRDFNKRSRRSREIILVALICNNVFVNDPFSLKRHQRAPSLVLYLCVKRWAKLKFHSEGYFKFRMKRKKINSRNWTVEMIRTKGWAPIPIHLRFFRFRIPISKDIANERTEQNFNRATRRIFRTLADVNK